MPSVAINLLLTEGIVYAGDVLDATVLVDSSDPNTVIHELNAEVRGVGRTGWVNIHTDKIYQTDAEYLNLFIPICSAAATDTHLPIIQLPPGRHRFPLQLRIPENMPNSFESQFGSIRYTIKITLLTNNEHSSAVECFPFLVMARSCFEDIPQAIMQPINYKDEVDFTVCSLPFGTVYLSINLPKTAFYLGEAIDARIQIKNATRKALKECKLSLLLKSQFEAKSRYEQSTDEKLVEQSLEIWMLGKVKGRTEVTFNECPLKVPQNIVPTHRPSSEFNSINIIVISYVLKFMAIPEIETEIPIIITSDGYRNSHGVAVDAPPPTNSASFYDNDVDPTANMYPHSSSPRGATAAGKRNRLGKRVSIFETNEKGRALYYSP